MEKKKTTRGTKRTVMLYLLVLIVLYVIIYVVPRVSDIFVTTYSAEYGILQVEDQAECLFVRTEKVYTADSGGTVDRVVQAGRLMRTRSHIVDVGSTAYYSDMKGIVSYYYDGYEDVFTPDSIETLTYEDYRQVSGEEGNPVSEASDGAVNAGDVLFKIVDNQEWYLACWIDAGNEEKYQEGASVFVVFAGEDTDDGEETEGLETQVEKTVVQGEKVMVILSCNRYYGDFDRDRIDNCRLITSRNSGIILEKDSIVEQDGQTGVYVVDKLGNQVFTPVKILAQNGEKAVVENNYYYDDQGNSVETVKNYDEIVRNRK